MLITYLKTEFQLLRQRLLTVPETEEIHDGSHHFSMAELSAMVPQVQLPK